MPTPSNEYTFQPLIAAHDFISSRLLNFFNNDDFADATFVVNEFDVFAMFIASLALLNSKEQPEEELGLVIEDFHATMISAIVGRIVAGQTEQVTADKKEALTAMIKKIFEDRFRQYFHIFKVKEGEQEEQMYSRLADAFLENGVKEHSSPQTLARFSSFLGELFHETKALLRDASQQSAR
ncbi:MAG: hypothetical protein C0613_00015 [Desulfobulbaceae bacterium]|nr:MAG: hypothetical protein C0613_00015 [Desulfobulbaceae bacterium]